MAHAKKKISEKYSRALTRDIVAMSKSDETRYVVEGYRGGTRVVRKVSDQQVWHAMPWSG